MNPKNIFRRIERKLAAVIRSLKITLDGRAVLIPVPVKTAAGGRRNRSHD
jgi:hypothetical protein